MNHRGALVFVLQACAAIAGAQGKDPPAASGRFDSKGLWFEVADAYAFRARGFRSDEAVFVVAVSNARFAREALDRFVDRRLALDKRFKDENTGLVFFEFSTRGAFQGISYSLGPGNGCGYCSGSHMKSSVKLRSGRLVGNLEGNKEGVTWTIRVDVGLSSDDHGAPLGANGGEPGAAYLAHHAAASKTDLAALTSVRIKQGFAKGDQAVLLIEGEGPIGKRRGEVVLLRQSGVWRVEDEVTEMSPD